MIWFYLVSGILFGWSLGANDAANIFGTAVGTRMVKFRVAALTASMFVILGAVISGSGTTATLNNLGAINAMAGSFTVALGAAITVSGMTRLRLPVSTTQAIIGGILGWNWFTGSSTDFTVLTEIVSTWLFSPILAAIFASVLFHVLRLALRRIHAHILELDSITRYALVFIGAFGAYSLGANNIANVVGVFVPADPFRDVEIAGIFDLKGFQILFLLGGIAISLGIYTYSGKVMRTVGNDLYKLTPITALIVVLSVSVVMFIFASQKLQHFLMSAGLPAIPLVPVSSSQAIIGAVFGIGISKGGKGIRYPVLARIAAGWITTPLLTALITFVMLFFMQNVFELQVVSR